MSSESLSARPSLTMPVATETATIVEDATVPNGSSEKKRDLELGESGSSKQSIDRSVGDSNKPDEWETDPDNPRNWPAKKKWLNVAIVSIYTFIPPLASSMMAPSLSEIAIKYHITSQTVVALTLCIFLLTFALGPLIIAPLSEMYGRTWVYHIGNMFSLAFNLGCAFSPNVGALIAFRFLSGLSGSVPIALGGGSVADLFSERERASAMALYSLGPLVGPGLGPVAGGFIAEKIGVKWVFIIISAMCALVGAISIPILSETYGPVVRRRKILQSNDEEKIADIKTPYAGTTKTHYIITNITRPLILLTSFLCFILSVYMAFLYGIYYLMFTTFAALFAETYGFSIGASGLVYLGPAIGFLLATLVSAKLGDLVYGRLSDRNGGKGKPEFRMPVLILGSLIVPIGVFWYGWSAQAKVHWIMPIIGSAIFGFGMMVTFLPIQLYLVDAYTYAASAVSAAAVLRSLLGFAFPLFASQMFDALGVGGGNSLLAGLAIVLGIPFPIWIYYKGEALRKRSKLTRH